jgi:hypothetical protein
MRKKLRKISPSVDRETFFTPNGGGLNSMHKKRNFRYGAASLLMFLPIGTVLADAPPTSQESTFHQTEVLKTDVSTLKDTRLIVTTDAPLVATQNVLWCGTLQLAWNEAIALVGEKLQFTRSSQEVDQATARTSPRRIWTQPLMWLLPILNTTVWKMKLRKPCKRLSTEPQRPV